MAEARALARSLLRAGRSFPDYNMKQCERLRKLAHLPRSVPRPLTRSRSYISRRVMQGFREQAASSVRAVAPALTPCPPPHASQGEAATLALAEGRSQLELVRRQSVIYGFYTHSGCAQSILELYSLPAADSISVCVFCRSVMDDEKPA